MCGTATLLLVEPMCEGATPYNWGCAFPYLRLIVGDRCDGHSTTPAVPFSNDADQVCASDDQTLMEQIAAQCLLSNACWRSQADQQSRNQSSRRHTAQRKGHR